MKAIFSDDEQGQDHVYGEYKGFLLVDTRYVWGHESVAIPDNGETIRRKFIGYTLKERGQIMRDLINEQLEG
jgi:hypothetical protein